MRAQETDDHPKLWLFALFPGTPMLTATINCLATYLGRAIMHTLSIPPDPAPATPVPATIAPRSANVSNVTNINNFTNVSTSWPKWNTRSSDPNAVCHPARTDVTPTDFALYTMYGTAIAWCLYSIFAILCTYPKRNDSKKIIQSVQTAIAIAACSNMVVGPVSGAAWGVVKCMPIDNVAKWMGAPFFGLVCFSAIGVVIWMFGKLGEKCAETPEIQPVHATAGIQTTPQSRRTSLSSQEPGSMVSNSGVFANQASRSPGQSPTRIRIEVGPPVITSLELHPAPRTHKRTSTDEYKEGQQSRRVSTPSTP